MQTLVCNHEVLWEEPCVTCEQVENTPIDVLRSIEQSKYKAHINIPDTIQTMSELRALGITIKQSVDNTRGLPDGLVAIPYCNG